MLLRNLGRLALATAAALLPLPSVLAKDDPDNPSGQSTFISPKGNVGFALTIAENKDTELYFSIRAPMDVSWAAVGLGSDDMPGALYLIIYRDERGTGVTFSPRLAYGHYEPKYYDGLEYDVLNGTGIGKNYYTFTARCKNCRNWASGDSGRGYIDVSSSNSKSIYAYGPRESFQSSSYTAPLRYHQEFGTFSIDMKRTEGSAEAPVLNDDSETSGAKLLTNTKAKANWKTPLHGALMIVCVAVLMPLGVVLLRSGLQAKWHALNQTIAMLGAFGAAALGIVNSFYYQRSRSFDSSHQIIGFVVVALLLAQFGLGFFHHTQYKKTQGPTMYGTIHLWVGRVILFFGTLNCFIGFTFAVQRKYGMILAAIVIFICFFGFFAIFGRNYLNKKKRGVGHGPQGYNPEPWRQPQQPHQQHRNYPSDPPPGYEASSSHVGLRSVSPVTPWRSSDRKDDDHDLDLGTQQRPREFT
ncbi:hypothetical protein QQX98_007729 [Neonectria punicea]|uniref:Cytochrome b561 domain-containing protein n=1 Tax=Neonectria punicea TaxID=979145 RepID=A0ABR1GX68_9HYPO